VTAAVVAIVAAAVAVAAALATGIVLKRVRGLSQTLDKEIERGKSEFDAVVAAEVAERSQELERMLARLRADALSGYAEDERRIAEERRRDIAERERTATAKLGEQLLAAQRAVEQRLAEWSSDVGKLQEGLVLEVKKLETKQHQLIADVEARFGQEAEAQHALIDEERATITRLREELARIARDMLASATAELEQHASERRRALQELADRLRRRERDLGEIVERENNEAAQRIQASLVDVERRQVEALGRVVERAAARYSEAASQQFDAAIRGAREEAARRLGRELELAVERFAREAEVVLQERVSQVSDAAAQRVENRLSQVRSSLEQNRDDALALLEDRAHDVESGLRARLDEISSDAEAARAVLETRLHDLARRFDELAARA
jgi:uncharacterized protein YukE